MEKRIAILFLFFISIFITSCERNEINICDPEINKWINSNIEEVKSHTRSDFLNTDIKYHIALLNTYSPQQLYDVWYGKIEELESLNWNFKIYEVLVELRFAMQPEWFDKKDNDASRSDILSYGESVFDRLVALGLDEIVVSAMIEQPEVIIDNTGKFEDQVYSQIDNYFKSLETRTCRCTKDRQCMGAGIPCNQSDCVEARGCGFLGLVFCDGWCDASAGLE